MELVFMLTSIDNPVYFVLDKEGFYVLHDSTKLSTGKCRQLRRVMKHTFVYLSQFSSVSVHLPIALTFQPVSKFILSFMLVVSKSF